jgi:hypothetical protein
MTKTFTAYIEQDPETGFYVGVVPGVPGARDFLKILKNT